MTRVNRERAEIQIRDGAIWLDVRTPKEHHESAPPDSVNIPLEALRPRVDSLDRARRYICCCDNGERSAAAFVLIQYGLDACYLGAGIGMSAPSYDQERHAARLRDEQAAVQAQMVRTSAELDKVRRMRDASARRLNQEHLALERRAAETVRRLEEAERLKCEAEAARRVVEEAMEDSLRTSREQLEAEGARAQAALAEVERLKRDLGEVRNVAGAERRHKQARERELERLKQETQQRLRSEESRLKGERARHQLDLDRLRKEVEEADGRVRTGEQPASGAPANEPRGPAAQREVSVEAARRAAREEASRVYARYREALKVAVSKERAELKAERERLEAEATRVQVLLDDLRRARAESDQLAAVQRSAALHTPLEAAPVASSDRELELLPECEIRPPGEGERQAYKPEGDEDRVMRPDRVATIRGRAR